MAHQEVIPELQLRESYERFDKRAAAGRIPHPDFLNVDIEGLRDELPEQYLRLETSPAHPGVLRRILLPETHVQGDHYHRGVLLSPELYTLIPRNIESLGKAAVNTAVKARGNVDPATLAASQRARIHTIESKRQRLPGAKEEHKGRVEKIDRLRTLLRRPGYAQMSETQLIQLAHDNREIWYDMADVIIRERIPTEEQAKAFKDGITFMSVGHKEEKHSYRRAMNYWHEMTALSREYSHRIYGMLSYAESACEQKNEKLISEYTVKYGDRYPLETETLAPKGQRVTMFK